MSRLVRLAAVIATVLGLAALWGMSERTYNQGTDWEVPIAGYDPRDYLRGHYVEFTYDWPGLELDQNQFMGPPQLCLVGAAPRIEWVNVPGTAGVTCAHPLKASEGGGIYGISSLSRGRLYLGQDRVEALQQQLQDQGQRGIVTIRQREDGSFTPMAIRFRPLTPAEQAERDAQNAESERTFVPPPIMQTNPR
jgi:hypothetical protein